MGAGSGEAGTGGPAGLDLQTPPALSPPASNEVYCDPATRSFPVVNGALAEMHWVDQAMALRLTTAKGAVRSLSTLGVDRDRLKRATKANAQQVVEDVVEEAIADLIAAGAVRIVEIYVEYRASGELGYAVKYLNLLLPSRAVRSVPVANLGVLGGK